MPGGFSNGFSSGFGSTPIREPWRLWALLYDSSFVQVATIPHILSGSTREAVNQIGSFEIVIPANDIDDSLLTHGRIVGLFYEPDGEILRGRIEHTTTSDQDDRPTITISCATLAIELVWQDTYYGITADNTSPATVLNRILADAEESWVSKIQILEEGDFVTITNQFAPASSWQTALDLAEMEGAYIRETETPRELEFKQDTEDSGITLINPGLAPTRESDVFGFISGLPAVQKDGSAVINRVVPLGLDSDELILDLGLSDRSTPYTIQSFDGDPSRITNTASEADSFTFTEKTELRLDIECTGRHRAILLWRILDIATVQVLPYAPTIEGREPDATLEDFDTGGVGEYKVSLFIWRGVREGMNTIVAPFTDGNTTDIKLVAVAVSGVRQNQTVQFASDSTFGTGTTATDSTDSEAGQLVLGFLLYQTSTATDDAGQTSLIDVTGGNSPLAQVAYKIATGVTTSFSWALGSNQDWAVAVVSLRNQDIFYIEDATSISAFGRRTARMQLNANRFVGATTAEKLAAANTVYDRAVTKLLRGKDGVTTYDVDVLSLPRVPWLVGDSMRLVYTGVSNGGVYLAVDDDVIVLERQRSWDLAGTLKWKLRLANVYQHPASIAELLYGSAARMNELETAI